MGHSVRVERSDAVSVEEAAALEPSYVVVSPGPCTPTEAGVSTSLIRRLGPSVPTLGVCLGHQCVGTAYGAAIVRSVDPTHGKTSPVRHDGTDLFDGLPNPLRVTRYHSLVVDPESVTGDLVVTAWSERGEVMALRHRRHPVWGVQFHPEALLTVGGRQLLANFIALGGGERTDTGLAAGSPDMPGPLPVAP
jgi:anthranilate synthase component 2